MTRREMVTLKQHSIRVQRERRESLVNAVALSFN